MFLAPEILEPGRRQFGVFHCVLDVPVPEISLQAAGIVALVRQGEAAGPDPPKRGR